MWKEYQIKQENGESVHTKVLKHTHGALWIWYISTNTDLKGWASCAFKNCIEKKKKHQMKFTHHITEMKKSLDEISHLKGTASVSERGKKRIHSSSKLEYLNKYMQSF